MHTQGFISAHAPLRRRHLVMGAGASALLAACGGGSEIANVGLFTATPLVSTSGVGGKTDPDLAGAWGVAFNPTGVVWVNNVSTQTSTLYDGTGAKQTLVVRVPGGSTGVGRPTGIVFSGSADFTVTNGTVTAPARFIFVSETGALSGWAPSVNSTNGILQVDNGARGAVYTGLALATENGVNRLYATDFGNRKVDVFDRTYQPVTLAGSFNDPAVPSNLAPFGIQAVGSTVYVTYAEPASNRRDFVAGNRQGHISAFDTQGRLLRTIASSNLGELDAPPGVALAPSNFGAASGALLVGKDAFWCLGPMAASWA